MSNNITTEQIQKEHIETMGKDFGLVYNRLYREIVFIHHKWNEFESLYCNDDCPIGTMNKIAPLFFSILQNNILNDIILSICRITDPIKSFGKTNLTILLFNNHVDSEIKDSVSKIIDEINTETSFCRDRRNRIISHLDKDFALNLETKPLEIADRNKINIILKKFQLLINTLESHYFLEETLFAPQKLEGSIILKFAEDGLILENLKLKYLAGKLKLSDFDSGEGKKMKL